MKWWQVIIPDAAKNGISSPTQQRNQKHFAYGRAAYLVLCAFTLLTCTNRPARAEAVDAEALQRKQAAQQRARSLTRELITSVLDIQIRQLEENGLQELPLYKDVKAMRINIDELANAEMQKVVTLLTEAQHASPAEREAAFKRARQMIREIVARLSLERQTLLRRLKAAEIIAQIKRLIEMQSAVQKTTKSLPAERQARQEALTLAAIEDQRDIHQLFLQLLETLADVRNWGGPIGAGAADSVRILKAADVGAELDKTGKLLESAQYLTAAGSQAAVITGLQQVLEKLEEAQGLMNADRQEALDKIRELTQRQEKVRAETRTESARRNDKKLIEEQAGIRQDLGRLAQNLQQAPATDRLLERAKAAAFEATGELFEGKHDTAVTAQGKVLGNLAEIAEQLRTAALPAGNDKSAKEYAQLVRDLQSTRAKIQEVATRQQQVSDSAQTSPGPAKALEAEIAAKLDEIAREPGNPSAVKSRLTEAREAAEAAAKSLEQTNPAAAVSNQQSTLR